MATYYRYYQQSQRSEWKAIDDDDTVEDRVRQLGATKLTILAGSVNFSLVSEDDVEAYEQARESCLYRGPFYVDIDNKDNLQEAIEAAREVVALLTDKYQVQKNAIKVFCSGSKGMHVIVHQKAFMRQVRGVKHLPRIFKEMAKELFVFGMDFQVYSEGRGVSWRLANVQREDGKYRVEITHDELASLNEEKYREYVKAPRHLYAWEGDIQLAANFAALFENCKKKALKPPKPVSVLSDEELEPIKHATPRCVELLASGKVRESKNFNEVALQLGIYLARAGADRERARSMLKLLAENTSSSQYASKSARYRHAVGVWQYARHTPTYKFSCSAMRDTVVGNPCEGCPVSNGISESVQDSLGIFEAEDGYYVGTKDNSTRISNFTIKVENVLTEIPEDGSAERRVGFEAQLLADSLPNKSVTLYMNEDMWVSRNAFLKATQGYGNLTFTGSETDVQKVKALVFSNEEDMGKVVQVHTAGIILQELKTVKKDIKVYVEPGFSLTELGTRGTHRLLTNIGGMPELGDVSIPNAGEQEVNEAIEALAQCNAPYITGILLGWYSACHLKTHLHRLYHQFPLLLLWGTAGSGKTTTAELFSTLSGVPRSKVISMSLPNTTEFPILQSASSTTTVPRIFDEYNEAKMDRNKYNRVSEILKAAWGQQSIARGTLQKQQMKDRMGASTIQIPVTAPIVYISEQSVEMPALRQRSVMVMVSRESRQGRKRHFVKAGKLSWALMKLARAMMYKALLVPLDAEFLVERISAYEELPELVELDDRPRYSYAVCLLGLDFLESTLKEYGMPAAELVDELKREVLHGIAAEADDFEIERTRSEVDTVVGDILSLISLSESGVEKYAKEGDHYYVLGNKLYVNMHLLFVQYKRYVTRGGSKPLFGTASTFLKLLREEPYFVSENEAHQNNPNIKMVVLDINKMMRKQIPIPIEYGGGM